MNPKKIGFINDAKRPIVKAHLAEIIQAIVGAGKLPTTSDARQAVEDAVVKEAECLSGKKAGRDLGVVMNPEFLTVH